MDANLTRCKQNNRGVKPANNGAVLQSIGSHLGKQESFIQPEEDDCVFVNCKVANSSLQASNLINRPPVAPIAFI